MCRVIGLTSICDIVFVDGGGKCEGEDGIEGVKKFIFGIALQGRRRAQRVKWLQTLTDELWVRATVTCMVCLPYKMHFFQGTRTSGQRKPRRH